MKDTNVNPNTRELVIPSNYVCENCAHSYRHEPWHYRGACCAAFEECDDTVIAVYEDVEATICRRAAVEGFIGRTCADDNRFHLRGDYGHAADGNYYSDDYCRAHFYQCEECGEWVERDDYDRDVYMCRDCAELYYREQNSIIGNWHEHKGCFTVVGDRNDPFTLGFEMEVEGYNVDHEETAREIYDIFDDAFVFEYDCSLYDGFEIISQPHTLEAFERLDVEGLSRLLVLEGYEETDDASTTGLHVHFSTAFLGDSEALKVRTLARVIRFYDSNFDLLCDMTARKDTGHSAPNAYENMSVNHYQYDDDEAIVRANIEGSRYVAVNCNNYRRGTIEMRLCDGTISAAKVRAWVDFNIALMQCLQENDTNDICDVVPYMSDRAVSFFADSL